MSNHYHLVVHIDRDKAKSLSNEQVIERWCSLHKPLPLIHRYLTNSLTSEAAVDVCQSIINDWRKRLADLSWFMRELNIDIAVRANKEEQLTAPSLHPFIGNPTNAIIKGIPLPLHDYLELVEWTGRQIREGKSGYITTSTLPLLERLHFEQRVWLKACTQFERQRALIIGTAQSIQIATAQMNRCKAQGYRLAS